MMSDLERLWHRAAELTPGSNANRLALGKLFLELRDLYSERSPADVRRTPGHGTFEQECLRRGYRPRTVREWVSDYEAHLKGLPPSAAKRKARRAGRISGSFDEAAYRLLGEVMGGPSDPLTEFVRLLPFRALQAAYREAAKELHPDHGGNAQDMQKLIAAWALVKDSRRGHDNDKTRAA